MTFLDVSRGNEPPSRATVASYAILHLFRDAGRSVTQAAGATGLGMGTENEECGWKVERVERPRVERTRIAELCACVIGCVVIHVGSCPRYVTGRRSNDRLRK